MSNKSRNTRNLLFKKILVTGGAGFIGSTLAKRIIKSGSELHIIDNLTTGSLSNLPVHPNLFFHYGSVLDKPFLDKFKTYKFDLIINLASIVGMKLATKNKKLVYETSIIGTKNLISAINDVPIIMFSSSSVYGFSDKEPLHEKMKIDRNMLVEFDGQKEGYACGKWDSENLVLKESSKGRKALIIRPFNIIGPFQVSDFGMVVPTLIKQALEDKVLTIYDDGTQIRSFSCVNTFVDCLFQLIDHAELWEFGKNIINIGAGIGYSINDLAKIIISETKSISTIEYIPYNDIFNNHVDVRCRIPDSSYAESYCKDLKWPDLRSIIKRIIAHQKLALAN